MKRLVRASRLAILLAAFLATAGFGQTVPVPVSVTLEAADIYTGFRGESRRSVAALPNGGFATVWSRSFDLFTSDVYLQLVRADGTLVFESSGRAVAASAAWERDAVVAAHAREGALVAWRHVSNRVTFSQLGFQWIDGQGRPRWGAGVVAAPSPLGEFQEEPALLASPDGGAFTCFRRISHQATVINRIDCQRFSSKGKRLWGKHGVRVFFSQGDMEAPQLVADGAGGVLVFWRAGAAGGIEGPGSIRGQRLGPDGRLLWGGGVEGRIFYETLNPSSAYPREIGVVSDGAGGVFVAFDDGLTDVTVTVLRVNGAGEKLWSVEEASGPDAQILHSLASGPDGGFFVGAYSGSARAVAFHRFTADGIPLWPADGVPVVDPSAVSPGDVDWLTFAVLSGNELHFAWEHLPGDSIYPEIRFGALDLAGNRLTGPAGATLAEEPVSKTLAGLAFDPESGASFVIWQSSRPHQEVGDFDLLGAIYAPRP